MKKTFAALVFGVFILSGCGASDDVQFGPDGKKIEITSSTYEVIRSSGEVARTPGVFSQKSEPADDEEVAVMHTPQGAIYIRFFADEAPKTVENFITHSKNNYYDSTGFHRVIDGFMIQGGDPLGNGTGGESIWGGKFDDEFSPSVKNNKGSLAMANSGPNTNGSQFFINQSNNNFLDNKHSVFGEVFRGFETVEAIAKIKKDRSDKPLKPMNISINIVPYKSVK